MSRSSRRTWPTLLFVLALFGCSTRKGGGEPPARSNHDDAVARATPAAPDAASSEDAAPRVEVATSDRGEVKDARMESMLVVDDPRALAALETNGASLGEMLGGPAGKLLDNASLAKVARYASLVQVLESDIAEMARADPLAGVSVARFSHRLFDVRWLRSPAARFELVGLVNRLDRAGIIGGCGEVRLVYRLAYEVPGKQGVIASRLPMTLSLELAVSPDRAATSTGACRAAALRWLPPGAHREGARLAEWHLSDQGALFADQRAPSAIRRVAVNVQSVRWPSTVRPDLGGHAEYVLRAFADDGRGRLTPAPLENTVDTARARRGTPLFHQLVRWITDPEHLAGIDGATIILPDEFSARRVVSVTPRGLGRLANRPFSTILHEADVIKLPLFKTKNAQSPAAFLRRLDDLSCPGCHQARSVAGFHFLGIDRDGTAASNALAVPFSPHFSRDQERRGEVVASLAAGGAPSYARPLAEHAARWDWGYGAHCGLGDDGFANWRCTMYLHCDRFDAPAGDDTVGICLPERAGGVGDPCEVGPLAPSADPLRDRVAGPQLSTCREGVACNTNAVGFPGGMCTPSCDALGAFGACGRIAILDPFNACLAKNRSFETCIAEHSSPAGLRRCSRDEPCRDDYICAGSGVCIPPYFVFQMRVDGHPAPPSH